MQRVVRDVTNESHNFVLEQNKAYTATITEQRKIYTAEINELKEFIIKQQLIFNAEKKEFQEILQGYQKDAENRLESVQIKVESVQRAAHKKDVAGDAFSVFSMAIILVIGIVVLGANVGISGEFSFNIVITTLTIASIIVTIQRPVGRLFYLQLQSFFSAIRRCQCKKIGSTREIAEPEFLNEEETKLGETNNQIQSVAAEAISERWASPSPPPAKEKNSIIV